MANCHPTCADAAPSMRCARTCSASPRGPQPPALAERVPPLPSARQAGGGGALASRWQGLDWPTRSYLTWLLKDVATEKLERWAGGAGGAVPRGWFKRLHTAAGNVLEVDNGNWF
jgi:hypothetical protein